jgi:hypothetical protein
MGASMALTRARTIQKLNIKKSNSVKINGGQFLLHFQETTFGVIMSREGHENGKCNDSAINKKENQKLERTL